MKLPFLAYGAREGYIWLNGNGMSTALRDRLRKAAGKLPDFDLGEPTSCGVVNTDDNVLIYRFMQEVNADSRGRTGTYLAMTYFPRAMSATVNAEDVLNTKLFKEPARNPPDFFEYTGGAAVTPTAWQPPSNLTLDGIFSRDGSMAATCMAFTTAFTGTLRFSRDDTDHKHGCHFVYRPPLQPVTVMHTLPQLHPSQPPNPILPSNQDTKMGHQGCPWPIFVGTAVLMLLAGVLLGILLSRPCGPDKPQSVPVPTPDHSTNHQAQTAFAPETNKSPQGVRND